MYLDREPALIRRYFAGVEGRCVQYRRAGEGPALLLLHQSPTSSAEMATQILHFASRFTVIAPDTPGYGLSDPLPAECPEMEDYARALAAFLDVLGIEKAGLYGTHTGAMIAAEFGRSFPDRTSAVILDGYVVLEEDERADILANYFVDVPARADGSHLPWYWARIRDQTIFFPWYRKTKEARMRFDVPPAGMLQPYLVDLLLADRIGTPAYAAAFRYPARERVAQFVAPTYLLNYPADAISHHPERLGALPQCVVRDMLPDPQALLDRASELLLAHAPDSVPPPPPQPEQRRFVDTDAGQLMVRTIGSGPNVLLLHPAGSSSARYMPDNSPIPGHRLVVPDLPGHGGSGHAACESFPMLVRVIEQVAEQMEATQIVAFEASGRVALALRANRPDLQVILVDVPGPGPEVWPELTPDDHGGHLLAAWRCARDSQLFRPWHQADLAHALEWDFDLAPDKIHKRTVDLLVAAASLQSWSQLAEAEAPPGLVSLSKGTPIRVIARSGSGAEASSQELAQAAGIELEVCDPGGMWQTVFGNSPRER